MYEKVASVWAGLYWGRVVHCNLCPQTPGGAGDGWFQALHVPRSQVHPYLGIGCVIDQPLCAA